MARGWRPSSGDGIGGPGSLNGGGQALFNARRLPRTCSPAMTVSAAWRGLSSPAPRDRGPLLATRARPRLGAVQLGQSTPPDSRCHKRQRSRLMLWRSERGSSADREPRDQPTSADWRAWRARRPKCTSVPRETFPSASPREGPAIEVPSSRGLVRHQRNPLSARSRVFHVKRSITSNLPEARVTECFT